MQQNITTGMKRKNRKCSPHPNVNLRVKGLGKHYSICEKKDSEKSSIADYASMHKKEYTYDARNSDIYQLCKNLQALLLLMSYSTHGSPQIQSSLWTRLNPTNSNRFISSHPQASFPMCLDGSHHSYSNIWWHRTISVSLEVYIFINVVV